MNDQSQKNKFDVVSALLHWYREKKRPLPWRETKDPYRIWVSEVMLQQTRVDTVIPYFNRFMERYPTLRHLANAEEAEVLKMWEGLGYYSRGRHLLQAVREVAEKYGGSVPEEERELESLPGIGAYTKGAILSIAYGQAVPAIDGNVLRVASRIFGITDEIGRSGTQKKIKAHLSRIIPADFPGEFNQALMELGALICIPKSPACEDCPISSHCEAKRLGIEKELPKKEKKVKGKIETRNVLILHSPQGFLMRQRKERLLHGMWEFPNWITNGGIYPPSSFTELPAPLFPAHPIPIGEVIHEFTHKVWKLRIYSSQEEHLPEISKGIEGSFQWIGEGHYSDLPVPVPFQKAKALWERWV